jgi:hypothetical protein
VCGDTWSRRCSSRSTSTPALPSCTCSAGEPSDCAVTCRHDGAVTAALAACAACGPWHPADVWSRGARWRCHSHESTAWSLHRLGGSRGVAAGPLCALDLATLVAGRQAASMWVRPVSQEGGAPDPCVTCSHRALKRCSGSNWVNASAAAAVVPAGAVEAPKRTSVAGHPHQVYAPSLAIDSACDVCRAISM